VHVDLVGEEWHIPGERMKMGKDLIVPLSRQAIYVLRELHPLTGHGFRAMARTILDEVLGYRVEWIEAQLAHEVRDPNGTAYNRTAFLQGRKEMMQGWADYLDELRSPKDVVAIIPKAMASRASQSIAPAGPSAKILPFGSAASKSNLE
jgi:integrase